eukprot:scaffold81484_cov31-Tisochrysis_lutea.AAC.13
MPIEDRMRCRLSRAAFRFEARVERLSSSTLAACPASRKASRSASAHVPMALAADDDCRSNVCTRSITSGARRASCAPVEVAPRASGTNSCSTWATAGRPSAAAHLACEAPPFSEGKLRTKYAAPAAARPADTASSFNAAAADAAAIASPPAAISSRLEGSDKILAKQLSMKAWRAAAEPFAASYAPKSAYGEKCA